MVEQIAPTAIGADRLDKLMSGKLVGQQPPPKTQRSSKSPTGDGHVDLYFHQILS